MLSSCKKEEIHECLLHEANVGDAGVEMEGSIIALKNLDQNSFIFYKADYVLNQNCEWVSRFDCPELNANVGDSCQYLSPILVKDVMIDGVINQNCQCQ